MLKQLNIKNFALIEDIELELGNGFSAITGETGAGKSIILGALSLVLGSRSDSSIFRNNNKKCVIEAHFDISNYDLIDHFEKEDIDHEDLTIFRREITPSGRTRSFINDTPVALNVVKWFSKYLIDIHSQHDSLEINSSGSQLRSLDLYSLDHELLDHYQSQFFAFKKEKLKMKSLLNLKEENDKEFDYNSFQLKEFENANIEGVDLKALEDKFELSNNSQEIKVKLDLIDGLVNSEIGLKGSLKKWIDELSDLAKENDHFSELSKRLKDIKIEIDDVDFELSKISDRLDIDPREKEEIEQKLNLINSLFYKHKVNDIEKLLEIKNALEEKLDLHKNIDGHIEEQEKVIIQSEIELNELSNELSKVRSKNSIVFEDEIQKTIAKLNMHNTRVRFEIIKKDQFTEIGKDRVSLLLSNDKGKTFLPLNKIASGGELSRLMLAVKSILSQKVTLPTIIFDEIDTGVSGEVARKTAEILAKMSKKMQVISITHLPQVASFAQEHYCVFKQDEKGEPVTSIKKLSKKERVGEIAKMLSGDRVTKEAIANAEVLLA